MDIEIENQLKEAVRPLLEKGRPGDFGHTMRVLKIGRYLLKHERGEEDIALPAIFLHDIGYSEVDFNIFLEDMPEAPGPIHMNKDTSIPGPPIRMLESMTLHMKHGATLARRILQDLGYSNDLIDRIVSIIAIHDDGDKLFAMEDDSALILFEADHLDRLHPEGNNRIRSFREMASKPVEFAGMKQRLREMALGQWFKTETAKKLAEKWLEDL